MKHQDWQNLNAEQLAIARLIDLRLNSSTILNSDTEASLSHPDSDLITSFVEGRLEASCSREIVSHLVKCAACRHLTAELVRTDPEDNDVGDAVREEKSPGPDGFIERLRKSFVSSPEDVVFAYQETDESTPEDVEAEEDDT